MYNCVVLLWVCLIERGIAGGSETTCSAWIGVDFSERVWYMCDYHYSET